MGTQIIIRESTYEVKGINITFDEKILVDQISGEEIFDEKLEQENDVTLYNKYRKMKGLLLPEEIKKIRNKFGVSQIIFARVLGLGDKTITRYENGSIQDAAQNNLIKTIGENPAMFIELLKNCQKIENEMKKDEFDILIKNVVRKIKIMTHFKIEVNREELTMIDKRKYTPIEIGMFILKRYNYEKFKEMLSPLKLQKLLSYVYNYSLYCGYKLFDESPQAWAHGPVFKSVYEKYSSYGFHCIKIPKEEVVLHDKILEKFILNIINKYGIFSAKELEKMTHKEEPWLNARNRSFAKEGERSNEIIFDSDILNYYQELFI